MIHHRNGGSFAMPEVDFQKIPEAISSGMQSTKEMIEDNPASSVLAAFGVGLAVGVGVAMLCSSSGMFAPARPARRYW